MAVRTHAEHLAYTIKSCSAFRKRRPLCAGGNIIYKTVYTRELDVKKHMSAYSIILDIKE